MVRFTFTDTLFDEVRDVRLTDLPARVKNLDIFQLTNIDRALTIGEYLYIKRSDSGSDILGYEVQLSPQDEHGRVFLIDKNLDATSRLRLFKAIDSLLSLDFEKIQKHLNLITLALRLAQTAPQFLWLCISLSVAIQKKDGMLFSSERHRRVNRGIIIVLRSLRINENLKQSLIGSAYADIAFSFIGESDYKQHNKASRRLGYLLRGLETSEIDRKNLLVGIFRGDYIEHGLPLDHDLDQLLGSKGFEQLENLVIQKPDDLVTGMLLRIEAFTEFLILKMLGGRLITENPDAFRNLAEVFSNIRTSIERSDLLRLLTRLNTLIYYLHLLTGENVRSFEDDYEYIDKRLIGTFAHSGHWLPVDETYPDDCVEMRDDRIFLKSGLPDEVIIKLILEEINAKTPDASLEKLLKLLSSLHTPIQYVKCITLFHDYYSNRDDVKFILFDLFAFGYAKFGGEIKQYTTVFARIIKEHLELNEDYYALIDFVSPFHVLIDKKYNTSIAKTHYFRLYETLVDTIDYYEFEGKQYIERGFISKQSNRDDTLLLMLLSRRLMPAESAFYETHLLRKISSIGGVSITKDEGDYLIDVDKEEVDMDAIDAIRLNSGIQSEGIILAWLIRARLVLQACDPDRVILHYVRLLHEVTDRERNITSLVGAICANIPATAWSYNLNSLMFLHIPPTLPFHKYHDLPDIKNESIMCLLDQTFLDMVLCNDSRISYNSLLTTKHNDSLESDRPDFRVETRLDLELIQSLEDTLELSELSPNSSEIEELQRAQFIAHLATNYSQLGYQQKALDYFERIEQLPNDKNNEQITVLKYKSRLNRSSLLFRTDRQDEAYVLFSKFDHELQLHLTNRDSLQEWKFRSLVLNRINLIHFLVKHGKPDNNPVLLSEELVALIEDNASLRNSNVAAEAYKSRGLAYRFEGNFPKAAKDFQKAFDILIPSKNEPLTLASLELLTMASDQDIDQIKGDEESKQFIIDKRQQLQKHLLEFQTYKNLPYESSLEAALILLDTCYQTMSFDDQGKLIDLIIMLLGRIYDCRFIQIPMLNKLLLNMFLRREDEHKLPARVQLLYDFTNNPSFVNLRECLPNHKIFAEFVETSLIALSLRYSPALIPNILSSRKVVSTVKLSQLFGDMYTEHRSVSSLNALKDQMIKFANDTSSHVKASQIQLKHITDFHKNPQNYTSDRFDIDLDWDKVCKSNELIVFIFCGLHSSSDKTPIALRLSETGYTHLEVSEELEKLYLITKANFENKLPTSSTSDLNDYIIRGLPSINEKGRGTKEYTFDLSRNGTCSVILENFWRKILEGESGTTHVHLICLDDSHQIPLEIASPKTVSTSQYLSVSHFTNSRLRGDTPVKNISESDMDYIYCQDIELPHNSNGIPIFLTKSEFNIAQEVFGDNVKDKSTEGLSGCSSSILSISSHGTSTSIQLSDDEWIDSRNKYLIGEARELVTLWTCSSGLSLKIDDFDFSMLHEIAHSGTQFIIASTKPVNDAYMPILACLFNQSLKIHGCPSFALDDAKDRLKTGNWFEGRSGMKSTLDVLKISMKHPIAQALDWGIKNNAMSRVLRAFNIESTKEEVLSSSAQERMVLADKHIETLHANRKRLPVDDLITWVRGYGRSLCYK